MNIHQLDELEVDRLAGRFPIYAEIIVKGGFKDVVANLDYRLWVRKKALKDKGFQARELGRCRVDPLYYFNVYCWTYVAKDAETWKLPRVAPFVTFPYQDRWFETVFEHLYKSDVGTDKSRDMGATWMNLHVLEHQWAFEKQHGFLLVSRVEKNVDSPDDPDCLFWKLDFIQEHKPFWMMPRVKRSHLKLLNHDTNSIFTGAATSANVGRGGRKDAILLDEFAAVHDGEGMLRATQSATNCRLFNSTPAGKQSTFYLIMHSTPSVKTTRLHWSEHPYKAEGLYQDAAGKWRSPWYDKECLRTPHPRDIAQELDCDYAGSDSTFFSADSVDAHKKAHGRGPTGMGRVEYDMDGRRLARGRYVSGYDAGHAEPPMKLWCEIDSTGFVADSGRYVLGADIASGTGVTPSTISVVSVNTRRKVAEWACANTRPSDFARITVAVAKIFNDALLCWENNGSVGAIFTNALVELGYYNLYHATQLNGWDREETGKLGWNSNAATKRVALEAYRQAIHSPGTTFINPSEDALDEAKMYVFITSEIVAHAQSHSADDPSGAKANHGDRCMADVIANVALERLAPVGESLKERKPAPAIQYTLAGRRAELEREEQLERYGGW